MSWLASYPHKIYTIDPGLSFVDQLAGAMMDSCAADELALSKMRLLLPTRRACTAMRDAFLRRSGGRPVLLPLMHTVGSPDEEELQFFPDLDLSALRPAIDPARRLLLLAPLIRKAFPDALNYEQSLGMAAALARFTDDLYVENLSLDDLALLVEDENLATNWQDSVTFLREIIHDFWPKILDAYGCVDVGQHRTDVLKAFARMWHAAPPQEPVIIAGTMASVPAVADLMRVVMDMPNGRIILPGFDRFMDAQSFEVLDEGHPQFLLKTLLGALSVSPQDIAVFPLVETAGAAAAGRQYATQPPQMREAARKARVKLASEMMRPAETLLEWTTLKQSGALDERAMDGMVLYEVKTLFQEARLIACILREVLDDPTHTAMVVTPNRKLATLIRNEMSGWGVAVDDSAGTPLSQSLIGRWFLSVLRMVTDDFSPLAILSFLKNGLAAGGAQWPEGLPYRNVVRRFEKDFCRGVRAYTDVETLHVLVQQKTDRHGVRIWADDAGLMAAWARIYDVFTRLSSLKDGDAEAAIILRSVLEVMEAMSSTAALKGEERLWAGDEGEQAARFFSGLLDTLGGDDRLTLTEFYDFCLHLMNTTMVRPRFGTHSRLSILGLMESRLQTADTVILAGLNEGSWPADPGHSPWMSRPMAKKFGMPRPERILTQSAHDFIQLFCAPCVHMTRSLTADGAPTVPARWLKRLDTVSKTAGLPDPRAASRRYITMALGLHRPLEPVRPLPRPAPVLAHPVKLERLSITDAGALMSDPYSVYAKRILNLYKMDPIDQPPDVLLRGNLYHEAIDSFTQAYPDRLPPDAFDRLLSIGKEVFERHSEWNADIHAFWWPRFESMAQWLAQHEKNWRDPTTHITPEAEGEITIHTSCSAVLLKGRADRIERRSDGFALVDYKTGSAAAQRDISKGLMPQLTLGGAMLLRRAFADVKYPAEAAEPVHIDTLAYWKISGKDNAVTTVNPPKDHDGNLDIICTQAFDGLYRMLCHYNDDGGAFMSCPLGTKKAAPMSGDYAHLARISEWTVAEEAEDDAA